MFRWYREASKCYVYLRDVTYAGSQDAKIHSTLPWEVSFRSSRWFTRGWTLQEMLAPITVEFFSAEGIRLGDKKSLQKLIHEITQIPYAVMRGEPLANFTIAERFSWASERETTREEDQAYCLFGIFDVYLDLIYGERDHAFVRLREAIERKELEKAKSEHLLEELPVSGSAAFDSRHNQYEPFCMENTRVELLADIDLWLRNETKACVYWLNGIAGTGKSTIARTVARRCRDYGYLGGSFFFSKGGGDESKAEKLFTTLALQLARSIPSVRRHICDAISETRDIAQKGLRDQWEQLIVKPLSKLDRFTRPRVSVLVIDALDECNSGRDIKIILQLLARTVGSADLNLKVFLTSRPEVVVRSGMRAMPKEIRQDFVLHEIPAEYVDHDLRVLIETELLAVRDDRGFDSSWPESKAITDLVKMSSGLFLWAKTACIYIREGRSAARDRLKKILNGKYTGSGPHKHLDQLYLTVLTEAVALDHLDEDERAEIRQRTREILGTIVMLRSPLSVKALTNLLAGGLDLVKGSLADLHAILHIPTDDEQDIRLHHPTFRDFLLDKERCTNKDLSIDEKEAQRVLAQSCRRLMSKTLKWNLCDLKSPGTFTADIDRALIKQRLPDELRYACLRWTEHHRQSDTELQDNDQMHHFLKMHLLHWIEALMLMGESSEMTGAMRMYQSLLNPDLNPEQLSFIKDARRLIASIPWKVKEAPLQLYCAALMYIRPSSRLYRLYEADVHPISQCFHIIHSTATEARGYHYHNDIVFTQDGHNMLFGALDGVVWIYNVKDQTMTGKLEGQTDQISAISMTQDEKLIASGSDDFTVVVFDLQTRKRKLNLRNHTGWINSLCFSPDGKYLVSGSMDETVRIWDVASGDELRVLRPEVSGINSVSFSPDGNQLAIGAVHPIVELYDFSKEKFTNRYEGHSGSISSVRFSHDGKRILSSSDDTTVRLWNTASGDEIMVLEGHDHKVCTAIFSPDNRLIASGSEDKTVKLWSAHDGRLVKTLTGLTSGISGVGFSPDCEFLAAIAFDEEIKLWHIQSGEARGGVPSSMSRDTFGPGIQMTPSETVSAHSEAVVCLAASQDGQIVASGCSLGVLKFWSGPEKMLSTTRGHWAPIDHIVFSPDAQRVASAAGGEPVKLWDPKSGITLYNLWGHNGSIRRIRFSADGTMLVTASTDTTLKVWDVKTGTLLKTLEGHTAPLTDVTFSPDDSILASSSEDGTILLWPGGEADRAPIQRLTRCHQGPVNSITFSPNGESFVSCSSDNLVKVWHIDGTCAATLEGHKAAVTCAAFSSDARRLASSSRDGNIIIWNLETAQPEQRLQASAEISSVKFSEHEHYIETDRGPISVTTDPEQQRASLTWRGDIVTTDFDATGQRATRTIFAANDWIHHEDHNVLWLPEEHGIRSVLSQGETMVLGHKSGGITFCAHGSFASRRRSSTILIR